MEFNKDTDSPSPDNPVKNILKNGFPNSPQLQSTFNQLANWFNTLPSLGKVVVVVVGGSLGFSLLRSVFQLVASLMSLALLGFILYLGYKFFITSQSQKQDP